MVGYDSLMVAIHSSFSSRRLKPPKLIQFDGTKGIVRAALEDKDRSIEALRGISSSGGFPFTVKTLSTSGTIRTLREKYFDKER